MIIGARWLFLVLPAASACASSLPPSESDLRVDQHGLQQRLAMAEGDSTASNQEATRSAESLQASESETEVREEPREFEESAEAKPQVSGLKLPPPEGLDNERDGRQEEFLARERRRMAE